MCWVLTNVSSYLKDDPFSSNAQLHGYSGIYAYVLARRLLTPALRHHCRHLLKPSAGGIHSAAAGSDSGDGVSAGKRPAPAAVAGEDDETNAAAAAAAAASLSFSMDLPENDSTSATRSSAHALLANADDVDLGKENRD